jgi:peptide/nickel transport system substrate-binding protein
MAKLRVRGHEATSKGHRGVARTVVTRRQFLGVSVGVAASLLLPLRGRAFLPLRARAAGRLVVGTVGDLSNLDPFYMTFVNYPMMENVYDQFVRLDNRITPHPAVIDRWTVSADGLKLNLRVRRGITYHDGSKATADDIAKCIMRAASVDTGAHQYPSWGVTKDVATRGNDLVEVTFKSPASYIVPALGFISLIRPVGFEQLKRQEAGSGPFKVKEWVPGDHLDLERFADYWESGKPVLDSVRLQFFSDDAAMVAALEAGTIDVGMGVPPREYQRLVNRFNLIRGQPAANFYYLSLNATRPPFDKLQVRQAMAFAMDKTTMTRNVLFGISDPIGTPWPEYSPGYFPELNQMYSYDLDRAKQLLTDAGYPGGIEFSLPTPNNFPELGQFAQILKASLAKIGSTLTIQPMDPAQWYPVLSNGTYTATFSFAGGTQWFPTRLALSGAFKTSGNTNWPNGIPPQGYVEGLTKADTSFDPKVQRAAMKEAATTFMEQIWAVPIAFRYTLFGLQKHVKGFAHGAYDQPRLIDVSV